MQDILHSLLVQTIDRSGLSVGDINELLDRERTWLYRLLSETRPIRIEHVVEIYAALELPIAEYFAACLEKLSCPHLAAKSDLAANPVALLRILRAEADPELGWLEQFRSHRVSQPRPDQSYPLHQKVRRIDDAREFNRQAALVESEKWLRSFERRCNRRRLTAQETSELATALGVWSSIQRALGRQALGLKALELAWELHGEHPWIASAGDLLERSSVAVYEHGYPLLGAPLMQRAFAIAGMCRDRHREAKTRLGMGVLAFRSGNFESARPAFERVFEDSEADALRRFSAGNFLVSEHERRADLETAQRYLAKIGHYLPNLPVSYRLSFRAKEARLSRSSGEIDKALLSYEEIFTASKTHFSPLNRAIVLLHILECQAELTPSPPARDYSTDLRHLIVELEKTPVSQEILKALLLRMRRGHQLLTEEIRGIRQEITAAREA